MRPALPLLLARAAGPAEAAGCSVTPYLAVAARHGEQLRAAHTATEEDDEKQEGGSAEAEMEGNSDGQKVELQRNSDGDAFFELSSNRRISVRKFKGKTLVDIREVRGI